MCRNINSLDKIRGVLLSQRTLTPDQAKRFFKTSPGSYGEGDEFLGVTVPVLRRIAKDFKHIKLDILESLLCSNFNEERFLALIILVYQYQKADSKFKEDIYQFYLRNLEHVNNWNLVDSSAHLIIGAHLWGKDWSILEALAKSPVLWERRIAIVSTWYFIRHNDIEATFSIAELLFKDKQDLIHKAVGWMLREAGKRNESRLLEFLYQHAADMPRVMFRYAIEKLNRHDLSLKIRVGIMAGRGKVRQLIK